MSYGVECIRIHKKLRLDKRAGSDNWYARLTLPSGKRLIKTTKTDDLEAAKEVALRLYYEVDAHIQNKLPATTRKFADVAEHEISRMETKIREGVGKQAYRDYTQALNPTLYTTLPTIVQRVFFARLRSFGNLHRLAHSHRISRLGNDTPSC